ncbi:MAG: MarR family winged helix-turn-helix transcriptional regulator [Nitrososphaeria archaeon]
MSNDPDEKLAEELLESIFKASRTFRNWMREDISFSVPQFRILSYVNRNKDCSIDDIALYLGVSKPTASKIVEKMRLKELLYRIENRNDRRKVAIGLTGKGAKVLEEARFKAILKLKNRLSMIDINSKSQLRDALKILAGLTG